MPANNKINFRVKYSEKISSAEEDYFNVTRLCYFAWKVLMYLLLN
jgi:hypothetical protein